MNTFQFFLCSIKWCSTHRYWKLSNWRIKLNPTCPFCRVCQYTIFYVNSEHFLLSVWVRNDGLFIVHAINLISLNNTKCFLKCGKLMKYALWTILENNCNIEKDLESQRAESCHLKVRKSRCYNDEYCRSDPNTVQKM